jgi:hypothetical protein
MWDPDLSIYDGMENVSAYDPVGWFTEQALTSYGADYRKLQQLNFAYYSMMKISPVLLQTHIYREGAYWTQVKSAIDTDFLDSYTTLTHLTELTEIEDDDTDNLLLMQNGTTHDVVLLKTPEYVPDDEVSTIEALIGDVDPQIVTVDGVSMELTNTEQDSHYMCNVASYKELADWFDYIRANDCWDNTRIIIVSDHGYDMGQFDYMELSNGIDVEFYNALLLVKDFGAAEYTVSAEFMTIADVPSLAVSGLFEDAVNPYTGNIISSDAKESAVYVTTSNNFKISEDQGNIFDTSDGEWYTVKDNIFDVNNWTKVEEP